MVEMYIKNMVCNRCIMVVRQEFEKAGLKPINVIMGEVELAEPLNDKELKNIGDRLTQLGFEILDSKTHKQIEKIKNLLIKKIQSGEVEEHFSLSDFISKALSKEYTQLSRLFSEVEGLTIEQFFILQKIEKVKEWLVYGELTLSEIAWKLGYSSVAHLSAQFKKITGLTPSHFKTLGNKNRKSLDQI
ncbi:MAG: AraC family transcriptional regulator [Chitinophagaceae bacterium]|nr:MAG: AraC family transcriptional regulator [Chitinophagaceae bacterium]